MKNLFVYYICFFYFLLFSVHLQAQSEVKGKWSAGVVFSPDYAYRRLNSDDYENDWKEVLDEDDKPKFGYAAGISVLYNFNRSLELESGLLYSNKGHRFKHPIEAQWHENDPAIPLEATTTYIYRYLDVPLKMNWFFLQKKFRLFLSAGISASLFLDEFIVQEAIFPDRTESSRFNEKDVDFNHVTLSLSGGIGIEYLLSERLHIRLNPEFRYAVLPLADAPGKYYLWSAGVNTGMFINLQR